MSHYKALYKSTDKELMRFGKAGQQLNLRTRQPFMIDNEQADNSN